MTIALITRCKNEPFVHEFVSYYMNEGVDKIFIYDDNSVPNTYDRINPVYLDKIEIIYGKDHKDRNFTSMSLSILYQYIKSFTWVINVDVDEFITSNDDRSIRDILIENFNGVDCIKIPWVFMSHNKGKINPENMLHDIVYRWDHDKPHPNITSKHKMRCLYNRIPVKSIFRPNKFVDCNPHIPTTPTTNEIKIVSGVDKRGMSISDWEILNFRENDIKNAILLCYHYRIISEEHALQKMKGVFYKEFTIDEMMSYDYPEIIDLKMRNKAIRYGILS